MQNFKEWAEEFDAYSSQSNEILDTLQLFIRMSAKGKTNSQADSLSVQVLGHPDQFPVSHPGNKNSSMQAPSESHYLYS